MAMTVKINAVDRTQYIDAKTLRINDEITDKVNTASFEFTCQDVALAPNAGETVLIEENSTKLFSGRVLSKDESFLPPNLLKYTVECIDHTRDLDKKLVSESYVNQLAGNIIKDIINKYTRYETSPTGHDDPDTQWTYETSAYDGYLSTYAYDTIPALSWGSFLVLEIDSTLCSSIYFFAGNPGITDVTQIDVDVYYGDAWHHVYQGDYTFQTWEEKSLGGNYLVTQARVKFYNSHSSLGRAGCLYEFNFGISVFTTTNVSNGPTISEIAFDYVQVSDAITKIAEICGYEWYVDYDKDIYFFFKTDYPSPFQLDDNQTDYKDLTIDTDISQIRNRVYVKSSSIIDTFGEIFIGDGVTKSRVCKYKAEIMLPTALETDILRWRGNAVEFSNSDTYLAVGLDWVFGMPECPDIRIFKRDGDTFTKIDDPDTLPTGNAYGVSWSSDDVYLAVGHEASPRITIYKRDEDEFTKLDNPAILPTGNGNGLDFGYNNTYLAIAHEANPYITIYKRAEDVFTKLDNPASLPTGTGYDAAFSPDGIYLAVVHATSPYITIYKRAGDVFTKLADPDDLPIGNALDVAFSPDGVYLAVGHTSNPYITIYKRAGDVFTKLANPADLPTGYVTGVAFAPNSTHLATAHENSPYITLYKRGGDTFVKVEDPSPLPTGDGLSVAFSYGNIYLAVGHKTDPRLTIYKHSVPLIKVDGVYKTVGWTGIDDPAYFDFMLSADTKVLSIGTYTFDIDAGCPAVVREFYSPAPETIVNKGNPANANGTITSVELYTYLGLSNCEVATFYRPDPDNFPNKLSTRDTEVIGAVGSGYSQHTVSLSVQKGDYIGIYSSAVTGGMYVDTSGGDGAWENDSDLIPCTNQTFTFRSGYIVSIYGTGTSNNPPEGVELFIIYTALGVPICFRRDDKDSITDRIEKEGGDGIIEFCIVDNNINSLEWANEATKADLLQNADPTINATFTTNRSDIHSGQIITLDSTKRDIDQQFILQKVELIRVDTGGASIVYVYQVTIANKFKKLEDLFLHLLDKTDVSLVGGAAAPGGGAPAGNGGATTFLGLTDTPANYTGSANKFAKVNAGETALEFATPSIENNVTKTGTFTAGRIAKINNAIGIIEMATNTDAQVADAVSKKHTQNTDTALGTLAADVNMGSHKLTALSVPSAPGQSVRTTATITEASLEDAISKKHTQNTDTILDMSALLASDHTYGGLRDYQLVGESVVFGDLLYFNWTDKEWKKTDADAEATMPGLRIALQDKSDGQLCNMLVKGYIRDDTWNFTASMIYASTAPGAMSSTAPAGTGDQVQRVGVAKSADILFFDPSIDVGEI